MLVHTQWQNGILYIVIDMGIHALTANLFIFIAVQCYVILLDILVYVTAQDTFYVTDKLDFVIHGNPNGNEYFVEGSYHWSC